MAKYTPSPVLAGGGTFFEDVTQPKSNIAPTPGEPQAGSNWFTRESRDDPWVSVSPGNAGMSSLAPEATRKRGGTGIF